MKKKKYIYISIDYRTHKHIHTEYIIYNTQIQPLVEFLPALWLMVSIASYHDPLNPRLAFLQSRLHGYDVVGKLKS